MFKLPHNFKFLLANALTFVFFCCAPLMGQVPINPGDHIVILGSGVADRMQHDGWFESYLNLALPKHELVIRNHGFTGDRVEHRPRNSGFMSADDYLSHSKANIVIAMFGYNESFDGQADKFKRDLTAWIKHTQSQNYSVKGPPTIVLVSPTACQNLKNQNLPDGSTLNPQIAKYAAAMEAVSREMRLPFLDLFNKTLHQFNMGRTPYTINGIHLNSKGNEFIGKEMARFVSGIEIKNGNQKLSSLRNAVLDKNLHWFNRYRATDGNDVWGSRSVLKFANDQTNYEVLQHELTQLDLMTANRDKVIWAAAQGRELFPDDSNVPPAIPVETNLDQKQLQGGISKVGDGTYLDGVEAIEKMTLADGLTANLFASEKMFPELVNPVQLGVGPQGRLWAAVWPTYPKWEPLKKMQDSLVILTDENRDGIADQLKTFAYVHNPTGFEFWNGGVVVASAPDLLFLKDTDGDDVADVRIRLLGGIDSADTHHAANNFFIGPDGFLYYQRGVFHVSNVESPWQTNQESNRSGMYRFNPRTFEFSFHADNSPNPHGISFDYWGYHYATDATGGRAFQVIENDERTGFKMRKLLDHSVRPVASSGILSSSHLPEKYQGNFILLNTIAFLGIKQYELEIDSFAGEVIGTETEDLLVSSDPNFRPTDFEVGDDGAIYVSDWCNSIIGHMQHNVRDPERDHAHGRIYRITADEQPLSGHINVFGQDIPTLLDLLKHPVNGIRHRVRAELSCRDSTKLIKDVGHWVKQFDFRSEADAHHLLEALWLHQQHNIKNSELLKQLLNSPSPHARNAARRVQMLWQNNQAPEGELASNEAAEDVIPSPPTDAIVISTVPEKMSYAIESFEVVANQNVKLWFENPDFMPHNLIIGQPNSAEIIGPLAEKLGASGFDKQFIPDTDQIIVASKLLNHQEFELIEFKAPSAPGEYDFVCTFPGHWRLMRGKMIVLPAEQSFFRDSWDTLPVQHWPGKDWYANRVQDWKVEKGKLVNLYNDAQYAGRTTHLLTQRIDSSKGEFKINVTIDAEAGTKLTNGATAGILFGVGDEETDYRISALVQQVPAQGGGYLACIESTGHLSIRDFNQPLARDGYWSAPTKVDFMSLPIIARSQKALPFPSSWPVQLNLSGNNSGLSLTATSNNKKEIGFTLPSQQLPLANGGISLFSARGTNGGKQGFSFEDFAVIGGVAYPERSWGPVLSAMYSVESLPLHEDVRMNVQFAAVNELEQDPCYLQLGNGQSYKGKISQDGSFIVNFQISMPEFDQRDFAYTIIQSEEIIYEGIIKAAPSPKEKIDLALLSCVKNQVGPLQWNENGIWFPHTELVSSVTKQDPDILFFAGDQIYEGDITGADRRGGDFTLLDYHTKWQRFLWSFKDLMRDRPTICIPDDHDVFHGNLWGAGGKLARKLPGITAQDSGGYRLDPKTVNAIHHTQVGHLPPSQVEQFLPSGISTYSTSFKWGGIDWCILADRMWKDSPSVTAPELEFKNGFAQVDLFTPKDADVAGARLLGDQQETLLNTWATKESKSWTKVVLSQTPFACMQTLPGVQKGDNVIPKLPAPRPNEYPPNDQPVMDADSNSWPQSARNRAVRSLSKAGALHLCGDQHLGSVAWYGADEWRDGTVVFSGPSMANAWPRRWMPSKPGLNQKAEAPRYTGDYIDGFGNFISMLAVANPEDNNYQPPLLYDRSPGFGMVRFNPTKEEITLEAWTRWLNENGQAEMFEGWPIILNHLGTPIQ